MPQKLTPDTLAENICRRLELSTAGSAEVVTDLLRDAWREVGDAAVADTRAACLVIAEDEAERSHAAGEISAQQAALNIATRIRKRHVGLRP